PEPTAHVHRVKAGETLGGIAAQAYGDKFEKDNDARLYVQALFVANHGRPGIYLEDVNLSAVQEAIRTHDEAETVRIYKGVRVKADHALWIPSDGLVQM